MELTMEEKMIPIPTVCADGITRLCYPNVKAKLVVVDEETNKMPKLEFNNLALGPPRPKKASSNVDDDIGLEDRIEEDQFAEKLMRGKQDKG
jgi:hypothetical protein